MIQLLIILLGISIGFYFLLWKIKPIKRLIWAVGLFVVLSVGVLTIILISGDKPNEGSVVVTQEMIEQGKIPKAKK